jgi:hypothetical protein
MKGSKLAGWIFLSISWGFFTFLLYEEVITFFNYSYHDEFAFFFLFLGGLFSFMASVGLFWEGNKTEKNSH